MASYFGYVRSYALNLKAPGGLGLLGYHGVINLELDFSSEGIGSAYCYFVPDGGVLGENQKRPDSLHFDVYFWMSSWMRFVDLLHTAPSVSFNFTEDGRAELQSGVRGFGE